MNDSIEERVSAGGIIRNVRGEIAIDKNGDSFWGFPKGHVDAGEELLAAAVREIHEETGLTKLTLVKDLGSYRRMGGRDLAEPKLIHMYLFETEESKLAPIDPHNPEARWVRTLEVAALLTHEKDRAFFESVLPLQ